MRLAAVLLLLPALAFGQSMYKCTEGGKTVFSERPCGQSAQEVKTINDVTPASQAQARVSAARQRVLSRQNDYDAAAREYELTKDAVARDAKDRAKQNECSRLARTATNAKNEQDLYVTDRYKNDARRRQKEAEDAQFSKCYGSAGTN